MCISLPSQWLLHQYFTLHMDWLTGTWARISPKKWRKKRRRIGRFYSTKYKVRSTIHFFFIQKSKFGLRYLLISLFVLRTSFAASRQNLTATTNSYLVLCTLYNFSILHSTFGIRHWKNVVFRTSYFYFFLPSHQIYFGLSPWFLQFILKTSGQPLIYKIFLPTFAASILT